MSESTANRKSFHAHLETAIALARVLEHVERSPGRIDADQYQVLVARLKSALAEDLPAAALDAVLGALPAAAEVYENMHYQFSGLSRVPLERSVASERLAAEVLARVSRASKSVQGCGLGQGRPSRRGRRHDTTAGGGVAAAGVGGLSVLNRVLSFSPGRAPAPC